MNKTEEKIYELIKAKATSCDEGGYFCVYPISELANEIRTSERTVMRTLQSLEEQKYILRKRQGRGQEQKIYFLHSVTSTYCAESKNVTSTSCVEVEEAENVTSTSCVEVEEAENVTSTSCVEVEEVENCTSTSCDEKIAPSTQSVAENCPVPAVGELTIVQRIKAPESVFYPLFKPTYTLFNNFPIRQTKKIKAESESDRRKGKTANILLLLSFDELDGVKISRPLTIYDKNVWNACANLSKYGYETVTAQDVYKFMGYNNNLNQRDKKKILESIETIIRARVFISNKEEHALYKKYDEISLNTPLLAAEICKAKIGNTIVEEAIRIIEPPKLFAIAERRGQITAIPFKVLESPINKNDDVALITDYLITRISRMKNNKNMTRTILLDTLYEKCNITDSASDRVKKTRLPEKIDRLLDHYKSVGWIDGYKLTKNEIVIILKEN